MSDKFKDAFDKFFRQNRAWFMSDIAVKQRQCCNTHGVRSYTEIQCDCPQHWDVIRNWCNNCGRDLREMEELHETGH